MLRRSVLFVLAVLLVSSALASGANATSHLTGRRVCLDPGHGGSDPGAVYAGMREADLNLDIAKRLAALLSADGAIVNLTRTGDTSLGNSQRAAICNAAAAEIEMSIHLNASTNPNLDYFQAFYGKPRKDKQLASTIDANYQLQNTSQTGALAHAPVTNFANGTLLKTTMPAVLVEAVFLSNAGEQSLLAAGTRQGEIAAELYKGVVAWFATH